MFDYQRDLVEQFTATAAASSEALLSLPTGGGKTRTAVVGVLSLLSGMSRGRVVWLAPTIELLDQAAETFVMAWKEFGSAPDIAITKTLDRRRDNLIWLTTPQAVNALLNRSNRLGAWDLVVFDEAHQVAARTYRHAVDVLRGTGPSNAKVPMIGLSATPGRNVEHEIESLLTIFGGRLLRSAKLGANPVAALQQQGVLAKLNFRKFTKRSVSKDREAERLVIAARAAEELFRRGRHIMVFSASVGGAYLLQDVLRKLDVPAQAVDSSLSASERSGALEAFARRETAVLINQRLLATGYDCPAVTDIFLLPEIGSPILFEQMVGRGARGPRTGGAHSATIWEFDDHLSLHGLPSSYYRYADYDWS